MKRCQIVPQCNIIVLSEHFQCFLKLCMLKRQKDTQIKGTYLPKPSKFNKISTIYLSYENINFKKKHDIIKCVWK